MDAESGTAILEFAIVLPFLIMMCFATYDLGNAINQYLSLTRVAYEGARYAAVLPGLESEGPYTTVSITDAPNQFKLRQRIFDLLDRANFSVADMTVTTENTSDTWVNVTLVKPYASFFGFFEQVPITVKATGPYLAAQ